MGTPQRKPPALVAMLTAVLTALTACTGITGTPVPGDGVVRHAADPSFVHGSDGGSIDRLAATAVTELRDYWSQQYPETFGEPWRELDGGFFSADTSDPGAQPPPCTGSVADVEGNAFYCAPVDAIAWDRAALLPVLRNEFGAAAVVLVLAHEMGHAVQQRAGADARERSRRPVVLTEAMADCYAGAFVRWVREGHSDRLHIDDGQLDAALRALITFRDPVGTARFESDAHGTAFDRVSALLDGYRDGPRRCAGMSTANRRFTTGEPVAGTSDPHRPLGDVLSDTHGMREFFGALVSRRGGRWEAPAVRRDGRGAERAGCATARQGPVAFCPGPATITVTRPDRLAEMHHELGDQATATLLASRFALASLTGLGLPTTGARATGRTVCLTGAYTGALLAGAPGDPLSPGDLDEAVAAVLTHQWIAGQTRLTGFERITAFRTGVLHGDGACGP